ncbi:hypothetical protein SmJEL517_g01357 [Synchytrium microbalum]|uniref:COP9 signalosome complex subunit 6 n=1 Tax=Synchytrium microbalum TaxID=1806994 RepID=A0A507CGA5_9FUNG|nr:uncharacterized protein SmJEL517_g01357 [Synchytrium microbalum]TPX36513.1 hypothetical protein SmJEL517_g01357 [Synchytrium microbalum]
MTNMETEVERVVTDAINNSGLTVTVHPLVIMNISDHTTRTRIMSGNPVWPLVIGALLGTQVGREVQIYDSYEIPFVTVEGLHALDKNYFVQKQEQYKQVFPLYDLLGWYATGSKPTPTDMHIHNQFFEYNESPLFLQLNPAGAVATKELPITVYETFVEGVAEGTPRNAFIKSNYKIETAEAERIAVDHVARAANEGGADSSSLISHLVSQRNAIKMLLARVKLLYQYVADAEAGLVPKNHDILRQIASLCNRLPTLDSADFQTEFLADYNDVLLITYLATITKGSHVITDMVDKFNLAVGDRSSRRAFGSRGMA